MALNKGVVLVAASLMGPLAMAHPAWAASLGQVSPLTPCNVGTFKGGPISIDALGKVSRNSGDGSYSLKLKRAATGKYVAKGQGSLPIHQGSRVKGTNLQGTTGDVFHFNVKDYQGGKLHLFPQVHAAQPMEISPTNIFYPSEINTKPHLLQQVGLAYNVGIFQGGPVRAILPPCTAAPGNSRLNVVYHANVHEVTPAPQALLQSTSLSNAAPETLCLNLLAELRARSNLYIIIVKLPSGELQATLHERGSGTVLGRVAMPGKVMTTTLTKLVAAGTTAIQCHRLGSNMVLIKPSVKIKAASAISVHRVLQALGARRQQKPQKAHRTVAARMASGPNSGGGSRSPLSPSQAIPGATDVHAGLPFGAEMALAGGLVVMGSGLLMRARHRAR
ncbi:hypothetical protein [Sulfobacillus harzensis]|uniref:CHRD domain-containing protein n=1 Tax=Sulfobacillus harzensis TaxID=2729629 RepID=A0A7Y0L7I1_9FIRM|nr:hypothetical protein [Sulfobacillus harzensis]NMP24161.1 hypothetical protein [Sulfobacillus harzensis]